MYVWKKNKEKKILVFVLDVKKKNLEVLKVI